MWTDPNEDSVPSQDYPSISEEFPRGFDSWSDEKKIDHLKALYRKYTGYRAAMKRALENLSNTKGHD